MPPDDSQHQRAAGKADEDPPAGEGPPVAVLNRNQPVFLCVPADLYEPLVEAADDEEVNAIADARLSDGQEIVPVARRDL